MARKREKVRIGTVKRTGGRKRHVATKERREAVLAMSAAGIQQESIALVMGISVDTLDRHYRAELDTATAKAVTNVFGQLYAGALKAGRDPRFQTSAIFFLKTRGGPAFSQRQKIELSGNSGPAQINIVLSSDDQNL